MSFDAAHAADATAAEHRRGARRALVALVIASLQVLFGMPFMAHGSAMRPAMAGPAMHPLLRWALLASTLAIVVMARAIFARAWTALRRRTADMDILVALGSGTAVLYSGVATAWPSALATEGRLPDVHFETASVILAFVLVGRALERRPRARTADPIAAAYAVAVLAVAAIAATVWWLAGPEPRSAHAVATFAAVIVVSCPCALGLASPTAIATATRRAAELGIVVRSGEALERMARVDTVAIDETAVVRAGGPEVVTFVVVNANASVDASVGAEAEADAVLRMAAAVERGSEHPVGEAIAREAADRELVVPEPAGPVARAAAGARAEVEGHDVKVGAISWLRGEGVVIAEGSAPDGAFGIAVDGILRGHGMVADRVHPEARGAVSGLGALGVRVVMLSAARDEAARALGETIGVGERDVRAGLGPEQKLEALDQLASEGRHVAMCGDAVDDATALVRAYVGIALVHGAEVARPAGDFALVGGSVAGVGDALELARRTLQIARQNIALSLAYPLALVPIAAGALVPWLGYRMPAALVPAAMALSSLTVVLSSRRLRRFEPEGDSGTSRGAPESD